MCRSARGWTAEPMWSLTEAGAEDPLRHHSVVTWANEIRELHGDGTSCAYGFLRQMLDVFLSKLR